MQRKRLIALATMSVLASTTAFAEGRTDIVNAPNIVEVSPAGPITNTHPLKVNTTPSIDSEIKAPSLGLQNYISAGYLMPDGFSDSAEDTTDGVAIELGVYVADYKIKGSFDTFSITEGGNDKDVQAFGLAIEKSLYKTHEADFVLGLGFERFDIAGEIDGFTDGNEAFTETGFNTETMFATLGTEFAISPKLSVGLTARYDFSHDDVSLVLNGSPEELYADFGFIMRVDYEMNEKIGFAIAHEATSDLMTQTRIDVKYKF